MLSRLKMKKFIFILIISGLFTASLTAYYYYHKPRESLTDIKPDLTIGSEELIARFEENETKANSLYLGKILEVEGHIQNITITENNILNVTIKGSDFAGIECQFANNDSAQIRYFKVGDLISLKGKCSGFLLDVVLVDCVLGNCKIPDQLVKSMNQ